MLVSVVLLLLASATAISAQSQVDKTELRVLIYPYIPDLNKDGLKSLRDYIKEEFELKNEGITLVVDGDFTTDLYDLDKMQEYLGTDSNAYDVVEADAVILGELVTANLLEPNPVPSIDVKSFFPFAVNAVTYDGKIYGIPTLVCANFRAEMRSKTGSGTLGLIGNFRGSWSLPGYYLSAYVNTYGESSMKGVISNPNDHKDVVENIKQLSDECKRNDDSNPCTNGKYKKDATEMAKDAMKSTESSFLGYSEVIGEVLHLSKSDVDVKSFAIPQLGEKEKKLQMYTDALVANKKTYQNKKDAIKKFMEFYTSDDFRLSYAFCDDMGVTSCTRYVLPANTNFYQNSKVKDNTLYQQLYAIVKDSGISAPNSLLYEKKKDLNEILTSMLKYDDQKDEL